ncbi:MAG TPA: YlxR family protein [Actinobacteria bacterium]|nr:YlxR family protein [Actinomycetota bacterium]
MISRKIPTRRCVSCKKSFPKKELVRIVRTPSGEVRVDLTGKANGRGAYVCSLECFNEAIKKKRFVNALNIGIDNETTKVLVEELDRIMKKESCFYER